MRLLNSASQPFQRATYPCDPEVHPFVVGDQRFLIDANSLAVVQLDDEEEVDRDTARSLTGGFLYSDRKPVFGLSMTVSPLYLVLEACHTCDHACDYCFVRSSYADEGVMDFEVARDAINKLLLPSIRRQVKGGGRKPSVGFFGGEPLLNWKLIEKVVDYVETLVRGVYAPRFHVTTNAALLTKERIKFLSDHNFSMIASLDGPAHLHNAHRKFRDGSPTWGRVVDNLQRIRGTKLGAGTTLRGTFVKDGRGTLLERIEFLNSLCDEGVGTHVSVEPACLVESGCIGSLGGDFTVADVRGMEKEYLEVADWYVSRLKEGRVARFHHFGVFLKRLLYATPHASECGAGKGYFSVSHDGSIFACHRETGTKIGNLQDGVDPALQAQWLDNRLYQRTTCGKCGLRYVCGGGCREESINKCGDIRKPYPVSCAFKRNFAKGCLRILSQVDSEVLKKTLPLGRRGLGRGKPATTPKGVQQACSNPRGRLERADHG